MAKFPDFDQLARQLTTALGFSGYGSPPEKIRAALVEVWNARGAADCAKVEAADATTEPLGDVLDAIRSLDR